jgi:hypothetical protein
VARKVEAARGGSDDGFGSMTGDVDADAGHGVTGGALGLAGDRGRFVVLQIDGDAATQLTFM